METAAKPPPSTDPATMRLNFGCRPSRGTSTAVLLLLVRAVAGCDFHEESRALYRKGQALWEAGQHHDAARAYLTLAEAHADSPFAEDSLFWAANLYDYFLDDIELAERYYRQLLVRFPEGDRHFEAMENLARLYELNDPSRYKAVLMYKKLHATPALAARQDYFQFKIAQVYLELGKLDQARFELRNIIAEHPHSPLLPEVYYLVGYSYYREGRKPLAVVAFNQIGKDFPDAPMAPRGRFFVADILEEEGLLREALKVYESLQGKYHNAAILQKRIITLKGRMGRSVR